MKTFLARCIFFLLFFSFVQGNAQVINGSDTVCAGFRYGYKAIIPGAVTFTWTLPGGWYYLYGQGTDSVFVNCNLNATQIRVIGFDSAGVPVDTAFKLVHWGGGSGMHVVGHQTSYPPCYCYSSWWFSVVANTPFCPGGCGTGMPNPNVYFAVFDGPFSYWNYLGPTGPTTSVSPGPWGMTIYVYCIDTTFGLQNMILVGGGSCGNSNNSFTVPGDPPCDFQVLLDQNPDPVCVGDTFIITVNSAWAWGISNFSWQTFSSNVYIIGPYNDDTLTAILTYAGYAYISFYGTDALGCYTYGGSIVVNYSPCVPPIISFNAYPTFGCAGDCIYFSNNTLYANSYQWSFPGGNPSSSNFAYPNVCYPSPGQYSVTLTAYNIYGSSVMTQTNYINIGPITTVSVSPADSICNGQSTTLSASGANTYTWMPSASLSSSTGPTVTAQPTNTTTYTVIGNSSGCTATATVSVTVLPLPAVSVTPVQPICIGQSAALHANGAATTTYTWSPSSTLSATTGANVTANPTATTTYYVIGTSANGCTATSQVTVTVNPIPTVSVSAGDTVCSGQSALLVASGATTYSWSPSSSLSSSTGSSVTATPSATTTYTVTGNSLGCTASQQVTVMVNPLPALSVSPNDTICIGQSTQLTTTGASTYTWSPSATLSSSTGSSVSANPSSTTTYTVTGDLLGCTASSQVTVTVNPLPVISVSPDDTVCTGQSATLNATGASTYMWSPASSLSSSTAASVTANPASTTTYTVVGDLLGCTATSQVTVTVNPLPALSISPDDTICAGQSTSLNITGANTYSWSPSSSLSSSTASNVTANPSSTTTYTVVGDLLGCTATSQVTVTVNLLPVLSVSPNNTVCFGQSTVLIASGANTYLWSPSFTLSSSTGSSVTATPTSTATYTVTGDLLGCTSTSQVTVSVTPVPVVSVSFTDTICNGQSTQITAFGATSYTWSPAASLSATTGSSVTANPTSTTTYTVTGSANGCSSTTQLTLTVNPSPTFFVTPDDTICGGQSIALTAGGASAYTWSPSASLNTSTGPNVIANPSTTTIYTVTATGNNGCTASSQVTVTVNPPPALSVSPSLTVCYGQAVALMASGASTYIWSPAASLSSSTGSNVIATPLSTTTYTITATGNNGCTASSQVTVTVNPVPALSVTPSDTICTGQSIQLTATGANTYTWTPSATLSASTGSSVTATPSSATTYTVIGDLSGCTATAQVTITVSPYPTMLVSPDDTICTGQNIVLTATGANTYIWSPSASLSASVGSSVTANPSSTTTYTVIGNSLGCTVTSQVTITVNPSPVITVSSSLSICSGQPATLTAIGASTYSWSPAASLNTSTGSSVIANPTSTTTYTVTATAANGCTTSSQITVTVFPPPSVTVSPSITICKDDSTILSATGGITYAWSPAIGLSATTGPSVIASPISTTTYTVTGTDLNGCTATATMTVTVNLPPNVSASNNGPVCPGSPVTLIATGANSYLWQPGNMTTPSAVVYPLVTTTYSVTGTGGNGCSALATTIVIVNPLPNVTIDLSPIDTQCVYVNSVLLSGGSPVGGVYSGVTVVGNYFYPPAAGLGAHQITYTYTDQNGCTNTAMSAIYVDICTGIDNVDVDSGIEIYPNPGSGMFNIRITSASTHDFSLRIFDVTGRMVMKRAALEKTGQSLYSTVDLGGEPEGVYYMQIVSEHKVITAKVVIQR